VDDAVAVATRFGRALRGEGLAADAGRIASFCQAAALVAPDDVYWAGRATLVARPQDIETYDRVFASFFGPPPAKPPRPRERRRLVVETETDVAPASPLELLREKSFARCSPEELARLSRLMAQIPLTVPPRRSRRRRAARAGALDMRRTLRRASRTGGEPLSRAWRVRRLKPRRLVFLLDVSGSMADYSRALLLFAHAAVRGEARWEVFAFGTRLTRITSQLAASDVDDALGQAAAEVVDWSGGTRIGESVKRFLDDHGHAGMARGAVVVVCSDGLEVGDPAMLAEQMARLRRLAHRVVWLNPLKSEPGYEPLTRGMRAALPHVDLFVSGGNLASLEGLAEDLRGMA
jgi:uncharacterized protein with von Willebrand factor type A (vWA) domain